MLPQPISKIPGRVGMRVTYRQDGEGVVLGEPGSQCRGSFLWRRPAIGTNTTVLPTGPAATNLAAPPTRRRHRPSPIVEHLMARLRCEPKWDYYRAWQAALGHLAFPYAQLPYSGSGYLMARYMGVENAVYARLDAPAAVQSLIESIRVRQALARHKACFTAAAHGGGRPGADRRPVPPHRDAAGVGDAAWRLLRTC
jgi:hypothetical protein